MATEVIHEHDRTDAGGNGMGLVLGIILFLGFLMLLFYLFSNSFFGAFGGGATNVQVPDKVDVNLNQQ